MLIVFQILSVSVQDKTRMEKCWRIIKLRTEDRTGKSGKFPFQTLKFGFSVQPWQILS